MAVYFLLHFPLGFNPSRELPGIIVLWSPDFPLCLQRLSDNLPFTYDNNLIKLSILVNLTLKIFIFIYSLFKFLISSKAELMAANL